MAMIHSNPEELPVPAAIKGSIVVQYQSPKEKGQIVCFRCAVVEIKTPRWNMKAAEPFVHACGWPMRNGQTAQEGSGFEFVIPCRFVTGISKGEAIDARQSGQLQKVLMAPEGAPAPDAMPRDKISEALHHHLTTSIGPDSSGAP
jgi:hypothetical protein